MKKRSNRRERNSPPLQSTPINQYKNIEQTKTPTPSIIRLINPANQDESQSLPRLKDNPLNKPALKTRPENFQTNDSRQLTRPVNFSTKAKKKEETSRRSGRLLVYASRTLDWSRSRKRFLLSKVVESLNKGKGRKQVKVEEKLAELVSMEGKTGTRWKIWMMKRKAKLVVEVGWWEITNFIFLHNGRALSRGTRYSGGARGQVSIYLLLREGRPLIFTGNSLRPVLSSRGKIFLSLLFSFFTFLSRLFRVIEPSLEKCRPSSIYFHLFPIYTPNSCAGIRARNWIRSLSNGEEEWRIVRRRIADGNEWNMPEANLSDGSPLFFFSIFFFFMTHLHSYVILRYLNEYTRYLINEIKKGKSD